MRGLAQKNALVTGAAKGIGKGIAERLASAGTNVMIADILGDEARAVAEEIEKKYGVRAVPYEVDLTDNDQIEKMIGNFTETMGSLDILVCNAGITIHNWATDYSLEQINKVFDIDLKAYYLCSRCAARVMKEQEKKGNIVCISSVNSAVYHSKRSLYNVSKAAVNGMVGTFGVEWARFGIRVNAVAPGYVATDLVKMGVENGTINLDRNMEVIPMKRLIEVGEIANAVAFLASDEASGITGQTLFVDGGWSKDALPEDLDMQ